MPEETVKKSINDLYACVDEDDAQGINCGNYKISIFFSPKITITEDAMFKQVLKLEYNKQVTRIVLEDNLYSIGLQGYMEVDNTASWLDKIINRVNQFYVIINITEYANDTDGGGTKPFIKYEPYIFDVSYVENISSPQNTNKVLRFGLMDCVTSIIEQHSIASVIQFDRNIVTATSYKRVFGYIHAYIKDHIVTNLNNKFEWKKDLLYNDSCTFVGGKSSGNDTDTYMSWLVSDTFGRIPRNATISEALKIIYQDACTTIFSPSRFDEKYQNIGNVLIPFYFKEEYPDCYFLYPSLWKNGNYNSVAENTNEASEDTFANKIKDIANNIENKESDIVQLYNRNYGGKSDYLLYRQMTMRDIYMPFVMAFAPEKYGCVFEIINPHDEDENDFSINGVTKGEVHDIQYDPVRIKDLNKLWKNVIIITNSNDSTSGDSTLIFFSWFYDYFTNVFLNESIDEGVIRERFPCACPAFHKMMISEGVPHGTATQVNAKGFVNKVDEHNSYTYSTRTKDTVNECMRLMGKNIASFVLANDTYTFTLNGNLRRRPNEIIKYGFSPVSEDGSMRANTISTGVFDNNRLYMYVSSVIHKFEGNLYTNTIKAHKFMEESNVNSRSVTS